MGPLTRAGILLVLFAQPAFTASIGSPVASDTAFNDSHSTLASTMSADSTSDTFRQTLHSPALLLFAIELLLLGLYLLLAGKHFWRLTSSFGVALAFMLTAWAVMVNMLSGGVFSQNTASNTSLIEWAVVSAAGSIGGLVGEFVWMPGMALIAAESGCSLAFGIILIGKNDLAPFVRWVLLGVLSALGLPLMMFQATFGIALATSLAGGFLLSLGLDLLVNPNTGMSLGLKYLMDKNSSDTLQLESYTPPTTTRIIIAVGWGVALLAAVMQTILYREPFIRRARRGKMGLSKSSGRPKSLPVEFRPSQHHHSSSDPPRLAEIADTQGSLERGDCVSLDRDTLERDYDPTRQEFIMVPTPEPASSRNSSGPSPHPHTLTGASPYALVTLADKNHPAREFSSPEERPTRPGSVVSTEFARGLKSRPPTFMSIPLDSAPQRTVPAFEVGATAGVEGERELLHRPGPFSITSEPDTWASGPVPVIPTGAAAAVGSEVVDPAMLAALNGSSGTYPPSSESISVGGLGARAPAYLARGFSTGRQISLAPTGSGAPTSRGETSDMIKPTFVQLPLPAVLTPRGPGTPSRSSTMNAPAGPLDRRASYPMQPQLTRGVSAPSAAPEVDFFAPRERVAAIKRHSSTSTTGEVPVVHTPPLQQFLDSTVSPLAQPRPVSWAQRSTLSSPDVPTDPSVAFSDYSPPDWPESAHGSERERESGCSAAEPAAVDLDSHAHGRVVSDASGAASSPTDGSAGFTSSGSEAMLTHARDVTASTTTFGVPAVGPKSPKRTSVQSAHAADGQT